MVFHRKLIYVVPLLVFVFLHVNGAKSTELGLASYYTDHMVLQMEPESAVVWGYANEGANISLIFKGKVYHAVAESVSSSFWSSVWRVVLDPTPPSGPFDITITSVTKELPLEAIVLKDVLFGDVWLCSGQSNMAFSVPDVFNASEVLKDSYNYPNIRLLAIEQVESIEPYYDVTALYEPWSLPSPASLGYKSNTAFLYFSAVCYLYGVELHQHLGYPIGLISNNWGGTSIQAWSSPDVIDACPNVTFDKPLKADINVSKLENVEEKQRPVSGPEEDSVLWNAMIHPMLNFTIKGVIWYQGEANTVQPASEYACLFPKMIEDWRNKWFEGTGGNTNPMFPFGFVQLCTSNIPFNDTAYPGLRWAQTTNHGSVPNPSMENVFMAVAIDLPDPSSPYHAIHPRYKQDVAYRLSLGARALAYKEEYTSYRGPFPKKICGLTNHKITVEYMFSHIKVISPDVFEVCCSDNITCAKQDWITVDLINQLDESTIMLGYQCPMNVMATYLRYIWQDKPCEFKSCAIYGKHNDLPGPPYLLQVNNQCT